MLERRYLVDILVRKDGRLSGRGGVGVGVAVRVAIGVAITVGVGICVAVGAPISAEEPSTEAPRRPNGDAGAHLALYIVETRGERSVHGDHDQREPHAHGKDADEKHAPQGIAD